MTYPATLLCDFYKVSHREQYPKGTETIYSTFTPRSNKFLPQVDEVVVFGIQGFIKEWLIDYFNENFFNRPKEEVVAEYKRIIKFTLGVDDPDCSHIVDLHDLGYLPILIRALKEGTLAPIKTPVLTVENTDPKFFWVTNYLETLISAEVWQPMTSASTAYQYRKLLDKYAVMTTGSTDGVDFQGHDFSLRGMSGLGAGAKSGAGHLLSFTGTDTIPSIVYHEKYYAADVEKELVGTSIPATEHSVMCSYGQTNEFELFKHLITEVYPSGFFSIVSDTWDFWQVVGEYLPKLKNEIMNRDGRVVIRPDSGDPVDILIGKQEYKERIEDYDNVDMALDIIKDLIWSEASTYCGDGCTGDDEYTQKFRVGDQYYLATVEVDYDRYDKRYYYVYDTSATCKEIEYKEPEPTLEEKGLIECLWDIFGGTINEKGYKVLDPHIGAIYGDSITLERAEAIVKGLEEKGFASTNVVFGIGSYTYQYTTRDSLGFAMKATYAEVSGEERLLFKDPATDDGTKRSQRGRVHVANNGREIVTIDGLTKNKAVRTFDMLEPVFEDGKLLREQSLAEIREILRKNS